MMSSMQVEESVRDRKEKRMEVSIAQCVNRRGNTINLQLSAPCVCCTRRVSARPRLRGDIYIRGP
jgi:hypothetical protein